MVVSRWIMKMGEYLHEKKKLALTLGMHVVLFFPILILCTFIRLKVTS